MGVSITSANAIVILTVPGVIPGVQLQQFSADDIYDLENFKMTENVMGADGVLSSGLIYEMVKQTFSLQPNSPSFILFEQWYQAQLRLNDVIAGSITTTLPAVGWTYIQAKGFLESGSPGPSAGKILKPRKFTTVWERVIGAPI